MNHSIYANRGKFLEGLVIEANRKYKHDDIALIDRVPTPANIHSGFYEEKSTVDFTGIINGGKGIAFDCKECNIATSFPLGNIKPHQVEYMRKFGAMGGISFVLVYFKPHKRYFRLSLGILLSFWDAARHGKGRKSIPFETFKMEVKIDSKYILHYLKGLI